MMHLDEAGCVGVELGGQDRGPCAAEVSEAEALVGGEALVHGGHVLAVRLLAHGLAKADVGARRDSIVRPFRTNGV